MTTTTQPTPSDSQDLPAVAPASSTSALAQLFGSDGRLVNRDIFKYNKVEGGALKAQRQFFATISQASNDEILALPREQRNILFAVLKHQLDRYFGVGVRRGDSDRGKKGDRLPPLVFPTPVDAVSYRDLAKSARQRLSAAVFPEGTLSPEQRAAQAAAAPAADAVAA